MAWLLLLAGCIHCCTHGYPAPPESTPPPGEAAAPAKPPPVDPVIEQAGAALAKGDVALARDDLERGRWFAEDRARAALLLYGCLLLEGRTADAVAALRAYVEKTTRPKNPRDHVAIRLLRHHRTGGGLAARNAEESVYFGLYALKALEEPDTARADLERGAREAPEPERFLARAALP